MPTTKELNTYGEELERLLLLRTSPIAVKMLEKEDDIPEGAYRPKKDRGVHLAQCQAFAMSRRNRVAVAMLKEDNWCPAPISAYGITESREDYPGFPNVIENEEAARRLEAASPQFEYGKYIGILSAPLRTTDFIPDLVMIYSNTAQLRSLLTAVKYKEGLLVNSEFDPVRSCVFSVVPVILYGQFRITIPDPGDQLRAMAGEDEIIFSVPGNRIDNLMHGLRRFEEGIQGYSRLTFEMRPDFPRPEHYKNMFRRWGLDVEE